MKSRKNEPETSHTIPYILAMRNEWIIDPINLHLNYLKSSSLGSG
jgi:hypothetical protein